MKLIRMKRKFTKVFCVAIFVIVFINFFGSGIYAQVNTNYGVGDKGSITVNLRNYNDDSTFLSVMAQIIYIVAAIFENIIAGLFSLLTGTKVFPWADRIIFNAIPFLDVNFMNPHSGSLFESSSGSQTALAGVIQNIYYTVFIIAVAFFSVCVGIYALRLVFATIASKKAEYKQAIVKVLMSMLLLFLTHYLISFIFFVNEKLVEVASQILLNNSEEYLSEVAVDDIKTDRKNAMISSYTDGKDGLLGHFSTSAIKNNNLNTETKEGKYNLEHTDAYNIESGSGEDIAPKYADNKYYKYVVALVTGKFESKDNPNITIKNWSKYKDNELAGIYNSSTGLIYSDLGADNVASFRLLNLLSDVQYLGDKIEGVVNGKSRTEAIEAIRKDYTYYSTTVTTNKDNETIEFTTGKRIRYTTAFIDVLKNNQRKCDNLEQRMTEQELAAFLYDTWDALKDVKYKDIESVTNKNVLSGLSSYFKKTAYNANRSPKFNIISCILYAIFLIQSLMYFIAYFNRFFYIIVLSIMAPLVIVYDFFSSRR